MKHAEEYRRIGQQIAHQRRQRGFTQQQLADMVGISKSYLSKIEAPSSTKFCSVEVLLDIAKALGVPVTTLFRDAQGAGGD